MPRPVGLEFIRREAEKARGKKQVHSIALGSLLQAPPLASFDGGLQLTG